MLISDARYNFSYLPVKYVIAVPKLLVINVILLSKKEHLSDIGNTLGAQLDSLNSVI